MIGTAQLVRPRPGPALGAWLPALLSAVLLAACGSSEDALGPGGSGPGGSGPGGGGPGDGSDDGGSGDDDDPDDGDPGDDGGDDDDPEDPSGGGNVDFGGSQGAGGSDSPCHPVHDPADDRLLHAGALAPGTETVEMAGAVYTLRFTGDELIEYQIDVSDPAVAEGMLRVREATSGSYPLAAGGPAFRTAGGTVQPPEFLRANCQLIDARIEHGTLVLEYLDRVDGQFFERTHTFRLAGKSLRVRVRASDTGLLDYAPNYAGIVTGPTEATPSPLPVAMQGTLAAPTFLFEQAGQPYFCASLLDLTQSNASDFHLPDVTSVTPGASSIDLGYDTRGLYARATDGRLSAPLDETLSLVVSREIGDVFVVPSQPASPYRQRLFGKTVAHMASSDASWEEYTTHLERLSGWGMDDLVVYYFDWWSSSVPEGGQNVGPDWAPAIDEVDFEAMVAASVARGELMAMYTLFQAMPPTSPEFAPGDIVQDSSGAQKTASFVHTTTFPLASDGALLDDVEREGRAMRDLYGLNSVFVDVSTYAAPSFGADQIDQNADSPWPKTLRDSVIARKRWLRRLQTEMVGPVLGEGSIHTSASNMEWLWSGYCDSVQRAINTGSGAKAVELSPGDPLAPTAWPVIPEYEWRVAARLQANHGNAMYPRFFSPDDGPGIVSGGEVVYPLTDEASDRYRLYELTYGHTTFFMSNGHELDNGNYLTGGGMMREYYLGNALQNLYLGAPIDTIEYRIGGSYQTFAEALVAAGSTDVFADPQLRLQFENGLVMFLNHAPAEWELNFPTPLFGQTRFVLPEDGFLAHVPGTEFLAFSGWIDAYPGLRFDYCNAPGRYEFFDGRGNVPGFGNLTTQIVPGGIFHNLIAAQNHVHGLSIVERSGSGILTQQNGPPPLVEVAIEPATLLLEPGDAAALTAIAHYEGGAWRDVSTQMRWSIDNDDVGHLNEAGVVFGCRPGSTTVRADPFQGVPVTPALVVVSD